MNVRHYMAFMFVLPAVSHLISWWVVMATTWPVHAVFSIASYHKHSTDIHWLVIISTTSAPALLQTIWTLYRDAYSFSISAIFVCYILEARGRGGGYCGTEIILQRDLCWGHVWYRIDVFPNQRFNCITGPTCYIYIYKSKLWWREDKLWWREDVSPNQKFSYIRTMYMSFLWLYLQFCSDILIYNNQLFQNGKKIYK